jgi:hypothetical protein
MARRDSGGRRSMECLRQRRFRLLWRWLDVEKACGYYGICHLLIRESTSCVHPPYQRILL